MVCRACGTVHHETCWSGRGGCGSYTCAPARRAAIERDPSEPVLLITQMDLDRAVPLPAAGLPLRMAPPGGAVWNPAAPPSGAGAQTRVSRLAIAAFVCGLAGMPLFGLITGWVAI